MKGISQLKSIQLSLSALAMIGLVSCGGGGSSSSSSGPPPQVVAPPPPPPAPPTTGAFKTSESTAQFLTRATFGPSELDIETWTTREASDWIKEQFAEPASLMMPIVREYQADLDNIPIANEVNTATTTLAFWRNAIGGEDQLRQRMILALSEILVISAGASDTLRNVPEGVGMHADILSKHAFGNYRELLEEITYSPGMGHFLTYMGNRRSDPETGRVPDENYAREILQLFTIGVVALNPDGTPKLDEDGNTIELYDNEDITGLAKVFTGLDIPVGRRNFDRTGYMQPMVVYENRHSPLEKRFLDVVIPANTPTAQTIDLALDGIMEHPNVGPFLSRQLIQRFVTSHPAPEYVERVASAFDAGLYTLPDGTLIGDGRKGDLAATLSAILFDEAALDETAVSAPSFGKVKEPLLRFSQWARAFDVSGITPELQFLLIYSQRADQLGQQAYRAPSVFNFFRPGYVPPGTETGAANLTIPELQITNGTTLTGYANFITNYIFGYVQTFPASDYANYYEEWGYNGNPSGVRTSFVPDYSAELALANDPDALMDRLDLLLTSGQLSEETRASIIDLVASLPESTFSNSAQARQRVHMAILSLMLSPDYLVQR